MSDPPAHATCPPSVRAVDLGHVLVLINYRSGRAQCLLPAAALRWCAAARTGDLTPLGDTLTSRLLDLGLIVPTEHPQPWPALIPATARVGGGGDEHRAGIVRPAHVPLRSVVRAGAALARVFVVTRGTQGMQRIISLLNYANTNVRCNRPATEAEATAAVQAVRRAGWYSPGRTACLEESAAALLLLAAQGRRAQWCHGVAPDPVRLHAWVQTVDGATVAEPGSTGAYTPVPTIGDRHQHPD
uniref:Microcin J25-processing protein McjB C-terminal domain-containing protein n=1 Tax=Streptomyces sp. ZJ306 TaxID=1469403 RepID=A0A0B4ZQI8_9ACTN|nr:hypothetical protein [Streptomyces sp. ZJ306]